MSRPKIHKKHLKKFSRLVQELSALLDEVKTYCPEAEYRLNTTEFLEFGIHSDNVDDYPYYVSEPFGCDAINDVGSESYCLLSEKESDELKYNHTSRKKVSNPLKDALKNISREDLEAVYSRYCNHCFGTPLSFKAYAKKYFDIDIDKYDK